MTRLSDSLRSLADRAPVEETTVSLEGAARRVRRGRRLRTAANATAGVGAAAVLGLAALSPSLAPGAADDATGALADGREAAPAYDAVAGDEGMSMLAWGGCGSALDATPINQGSGAIVVSVTEGELAGGDRASLDVTVTSPADGDFDTFGPQAIVVWQGIVVGSGTTDGATSTTVTLTAGEESSEAAAVDLVNCWDGGALPGGEYTIVTYQEFYAVTPAEVQPTEPATEPTIAPSTAPAPGEPGASGSGTDEPAAAPDAPAGDGSTGTAGIAIGEPAPGGGVAADGSLTRLVAEPVAVTLTGDVPEDPFGSYLNPVSVYPEDYLYPATARELFAQHATTAPWGMERGTQRVVTINDSAATATAAGYVGNYFSCPWDGGPDGTFPATSADWDLLAVDAGVPRSIDLQYGWVVRDNPAVDLQVTNTSGYTLPGFWGQPSSQFVLVKDGVVVAESYFVAADPSQNYAGSTSNGMLAPGDSLGGTFLWRDLTGCWNGNEQQEVKPGTYTLLTVQSLYLDNGVGGWVTTYTVDDAGSTGESVTGVSAGAKPAVDVAVDPAVAPGITPAPGDYDWLELQVWTSLGEVTVG